MPISPMFRNRLNNKDNNNESWNLLKLQSTGTIEKTPPNNKKSQRNQQSESQSMRSHEISDS
jgi:hypothetical protein